jgi:hypothetical protein
MSEKIAWVMTHCSNMNHGGCGILVGIWNPDTESNSVPAGSVI